MLSHSSNITYESNQEDYIRIRADKYLKGKYVYCAILAYIFGFSLRHKLKIGPTLTWNNQPDIYQHL